MIVVDAGALIAALVDDGDEGRALRDRLATEVLAAPELIDLEVVSVLRRLVRFDRLAPVRAGQALGDLVDLPIQRAPHRPLLVRCWELRDNLTAYDAAYVALAEALDCALLTGDRGLAGAPGIRCAVELI